MLYYILGNQFKLIFVPVVQDNLVIVTTRSTSYLFGGQCRPPGTLFSWPSENHLGSQIVYVCKLTQLCLPTYSICALIR